MDTWLWWLTQNGLIVVIAIPVVALLAKCRRLRPAEQHLFWLLLLVKLALPPVGQWPVGVQDIWIGLNAAGNQATISGSDNDLDVSLTGLDLLMMDHSEVAAETVASPRDLILSEPIEARPPLDVRWLLTLGLGTLWLTGSSVWLLRTVLQIRRQRRLLANSTNAPTELQALVDEIAGQLKIRPIPVRVSRSITSPGISCAGRTCLVWPAHLIDVDKEGIEAIVAHELAHVWRRDHWVAWLELIVTLVWWWNPAVWLVRSRLHETRELACDALSLERQAVDRQSYAEWLLRLSQASPQVGGSAPVGAGFGGSSRHSLQRRLKMLFQERANGHVSLTGLVLAGLLGAAMLPGWVWSQPAPVAIPTAPVRAEPATGAPSPPTIAVPSAATAEPLSQPTLVSRDSEGRDTFIVHDIPISGNVSRMQVRRMENNLVIEIEMDGRTMKSVLALDPQPGQATATPLLEPTNIDAPHNPLSASSRETPRLKAAPRGVPTANPPAMKSTPPTSSAPRSASAYAPRQFQSNQGVGQPQWVNSRPEDIELAEINLLEKRLELDAASEDHAANPSDSKSVRRVKLAELGVRRAEIELRRIKPSGDPSTGLRGN